MRNVSKLYNAQTLQFHAVTTQGNCETISNSLKVTVQSRKLLQFKQTSSAAPVDSRDYIQTSTCTCTSTCMCVHVQCALFERIGARAAQGSCKVAVVVIGMFQVRARSGEWRGRHEAHRELPLHRLPSAASLCGNLERECYADRISCRLSARAVTSAYTHNRHDNEMRALKLVEFINLFPGQTSDVTDAVHA